MPDREMQADFASLCFLSYSRPEFIDQAVRSAVDNAGYPCELIVHDDGSKQSLTRSVLLQLMDEGYVSHLILNPDGHNEGVGESIFRMFSIAQGDPVIKLDQDMLFHPGWLSETVNILKTDPAVGMFGFFKYQHEPVDWRKQKIHVRTSGDYHYTRQFCGSGFAIPRHVLAELGPLDRHLDAFNEDSNFMLKVRAADRELALPNDDLAINRGFGIGPSTVVEEGYKVHKINHGSRLAGAVRRVSSLPDGFKVAAVITFCAGREENLKRLAQYMSAMTIKPEKVVIVGDGVTEFPVTNWGGIPFENVLIPKHGPGQVQPRNVGAGVLDHPITHAWFIDSDMIIPGDTLEHYATAWPLAEDRILIGPYDWLPEGVVGFVPEMSEFPPGVPTVHGMGDHRWPSFKQHGPAEVLRGDLGAGLANFGGNLIWPLDMFRDVGGFHIDLYHGRCEDGELGIRACEHRIPMSFVPAARLWHVWHEINQQAAIERNSRDVPLLNAMHPWVQDAGLIVADSDGKRFDFKCPTCGEVCNSLAYWTHAQSCQYREETP